MVDLVTFGETMLRLSPPADERLERTDSFDVTVGGAESNVAVAASRLGLSTQWLSKLPDSPLGRRVASDLRQDGVDPVVTWTASGRVGSYYLESGDQPRGTDVVYDRADSTVTTATAAELPTDCVRAAGCFHTTGITPALSDQAATTTEQLLSIAEESDTTASFDLNYRSKLWDPTEAGETIEPLLAAVDLLFAPREDADQLLGISGDPADVARTLSETYDIDTTVVTMGGDGSLGYDGQKVVQQPVYPAGDRRPIGTGDAFVGGFLAKHCAGTDLETALEWGAGTAALKRSIPGDVALVTPEEVRAVIDGETPDISR